MANNGGEEVAGELARARARIAELEAELARLEPYRMRESVLEHAPDFLLHITLDGHMLWVNKLAPGIPAEDVLQASIYDFTPPAYHPIVRTAIARAVETRSPSSYETMGDGPNREPTPYFTRVAPVLGTDGEVRSVVLIITDVTRVKEAEAALAESQEVLVHVLTATKMGTWWWDREHKTSGHDAALEQIFGFEDGHVAFDDVMARIHPDDRERVLAALASAYDDNRDYGPIEHRVIRPNGSVRWVQASGRLVHNTTRTRIIGGAVDITERKRLEEQLAQAQKMESIGRLAGGIAHDFNNMLTAILSYNQFALQAVPAGSRVAHDLGEVRRAAERSAGLTAQLLAFARQQVTDPKVTDLDSVVVGVLGLLRRVLGEHIEVVPLLGARSRVKVDVNQFEQVLVNLATNAQDAMPTGGKVIIETADVELDARDTASHPEVTPGRYVMLAVTDSGAGIPAHVLPRVFEPFFTTKGQGEGTGLGLATCYGIVTQHHGSIVVESTPGKGTTFRVYLPRTTDQPVEPPPVPDHPRAIGSETVLVVEDEPSVRAATVKTLELAGFHVLSAANGSEAITMARDHAGPIDLLLTDVVMPQLGGPQLAQLLVAQRPRLAVVYVSGYTDSAAIHHGIVEGEIDFVQKPFSPEVLTQRVRQALDRRRASPTGSAT